jgi:hypothetical protein
MDLKIIQVQDKPMPSVKCQVFMKVSWCRFDKVQSVEDEERSLVSISNLYPEERIAACSQCFLFGVKNLSPDRNTEIRRAQGLETNSAEHECHIFIHCNAISNSKAPYRCNLLLGSPKITHQKDEAQLSS